MSGVVTGLTDAYRATLYRIADGPHEFILCIGKRSPELLAIFSDKGVTSAAYLTAYNPSSRPNSDAFNEQAQSALLNDLLRLGLPVLHGQGEGTIGDWPPEPSLLVLGLSQLQAESLGRKYDQNAVVWIGPDGVPELIMLTGDIE